MNTLERKTAEFYLWVMNTFLPEQIAKPWRPDTTTKKYDEGAMTPAQLEVRMLGAAAAKFADFHPDVADAIVYTLLETLHLDGVPFRQYQEHLKRRFGQS